MKTLQIIRKIVLHFWSKWIDLGIKKEKYLLVLNGLLIKEFKPAREIQNKSTTVIQEKSSCEATWEQRYQKRNKPMLRQNHRSRFKLENLQQF